MNFFKIPVLFCLILVSCVPPIEEVEEDTPLEHATESKMHNIKTGDVEIIKIDGCEYIVYKEKDEGNYAYGYMAHKGNCSNPIHNYKNPDSTN